MIYNSFNFLVLFPLIFLLYYVIPAKFQKGRNLFLLLTSYALYVSWKPAYVLVLLGVTLITYWGGADFTVKRWECRFKSKKQEEPGLAVRHAWADSSTCLQVL